MAAAFEAPFDFKTAEKSFRRCATPEIAREQFHAIDIQHASTELNTNCQKLVHLKDVLLWGSYKPVLAVKGFEGAFVIPEAIPRKMQVEMTYHSLEDCISPLNRTNLHGHMSIEELSPLLMNLWRKEESMIESLRGDPCLKMPKSSILSKLRWVTLGYHYDWTERRYHPKSYTPFPSALAAICSQIGEALGDEHSVIAEAAIVNFYPEGAVMGGHQDDAEFTYDHPVISISIGAPCLFLLGGLTKEEAPVAIILRSGDIVAMGGKCRLSYHGVPKVWISEQPPAYLHPRTAGSEHIHRSTCPLFLAGEPASAHTTDARSARSTDSSKTSSTSSPRDSDEPQLPKNNPTNKKRKLPDNERGCDDDDADNDSSSNSTCIGKDTAIGEQRNNNATAASSSGKSTDSAPEIALCSIIDEHPIVQPAVVVVVEETKAPTMEDGSHPALVCTCGCGVSKEEEARVLRFLQTTRLNINMRQVYEKDQRPS